MSGGRPRHNLSHFFEITEEKANKNDVYCYCKQCYKEVLNTTDEISAYELLKFRNSKKNCEKHLKACKFFLETETKYEEESLEHSESIPVLSSSTIIHDKDNLISSLIQHPQKRKYSTVTSFQNRPPAPAYQKNFEQYLIELVVHCNMPFSVVEKTTFRRLL